MQDKYKKLLDPLSVRIWRIVGGIQTLMLVACLFGYILLAPRLGLPVVWAWCLIGGLLTFYLLSALVFDPKVYRSWQYQIFDEEIDLESGLFLKRKTLIPMVRVQHVDTVQGPLLRYFDLAKVRISTAATTHDIPILSFEVANQIRDRIALLARVEETDELV